MNRQFCFLFVLLAVVVARAEDDVSPPSSSLSSPSPPDSSPKLAEMSLADIDASLSSLSAKTNDVQQKIEAFAPLFTREFDKPKLDATAQKKVDLYDKMNKIDNHHNLKHLLTLRKHIDNIKSNSLLESTTAARIKEQGKELMKSKADALVHKKKKKKQDNFADIRMPPWGNELAAEFVGSNSLGPASPFFFQWPLQTMRTERKFSPPYFPFQAPDYLFDPFDQQEVHLNTHNPDLTQQADNNEYVSKMPDKQQVIWKDRLNIEDTPSGNNVATSGSDKGHKSSGKKKSLLELEDDARPKKGSKVKTRMMKLTPRQEAQLQYAFDNRQPDLPAPYIPFDFRLDPMRGLFPGTQPAYLSTLPLMPMWHPLANPALDPALASRAHKLQTNAESMLNAYMHPGASQGDPYRAMFFPHHGISLQDLSNKWGDLNEDPKVVKQFETAGRQKSPGGKGKGKKSKK